jgi:putative beta-lysine N-acetyltransferase
MNHHSDRDVVTHFHGATIQHGPLNRRVYLMNLNGAAPASVIPKLAELADRNRYTKIFAKVPVSASEPFYRAGYRREAVVPGFFKGREDAAFLGLYLQEARRAVPDELSIDSVIDAAEKRRRQGAVPFSGLAGVATRPCRPGDADEMSRLYRAVFESYPFPIYDPEYLRETMASHVAYFCIDHGGRIIALSSAEMDEVNGNVEMTDFATHADWRGRHLATLLLSRMEEAMRHKAMYTAYTISRASSYAINVTFASMGYTLGGVLVNNTHIAGQIESMTVWYKCLRIPDAPRMGAATGKRSG